MGLSITKIWFHRFKDILVIGNVSKKDKEKIEKLKNSMSMDEYAGYSPSEQGKYKAILKILTNYQKPDVLEI